MYRYWRRLMAIPLTFAFLFVTLGPVAQTAFANHNLGWAWRMSNNISICVDNDFTSQQYSVIQQGVNKWLDIPSSQRPAWSFSWGGCIFEDVFVEAVSPLGPQAQANCDQKVLDKLRAANGNIIHECTHGTIKLNKDTMGSMWWGSGNQDCHVMPSGQGCDFDAKTVIAHEFGHIMGLGHVYDGSDTSWELCQPAYFNTEWLDACSGKARTMMYNVSGAQFQRWGTGSPLNNTVMDTDGWNQPWQAYRVMWIMPGDKAKWAAYYPPCVMPDSGGSCF